MRQKSHHVIRFVLIQFIALLGWIAVQSLFSLSPFGRALPFIGMIFIEAIWWSGLLLIMLLLFLVEYNRFVQATVDLEEANRRLRRETNGLFRQIRDGHRQEENGVGGEQNISIMHTQEEESVATKEQDDPEEHQREEA